MIVSIDDYAVEPPEAFIRHYPEGKKDRAPRIVQHVCKDIWLWNGQRFPGLRVALLESWDWLDSLFPRTRRFQPWASPGTDLHRFWRRTAISCRAPEASDHTQLVLMEMNGALVAELKKKGAIA